MRTLALVALVLAAPAGAQDIRACESAPVHDPCEIRIELAQADAAQHPEPYASVELRAEFRSPKGGRTKVMPAFWDGGRQFVLRFSPDHEGRWDYRVISNIESLDKRTGSFQAVAARTQGFIEIFNQRYFKYPVSNAPHYWLGDTMLDMAQVPWERFRAVADKRSEQNFTHMRALALGSASSSGFDGPEQPRVEHFRELDRRIAYLHGLGIVTDLVLARSGGELEQLFPRPRQRDRYIRYVCARYAAYSLTWQALLEWESHEQGARLARLTAASLDKYDPYKHPKSTGATVTSAPLAEDGWLDYAIQNRVDPALASIEYEVFPMPFVNTGVGAGADADGARRQAWTAAARGHYVTFSGSNGQADSPGAAQMELLQRFFAQSRYFDLQPHYRVVGGAGLTLQYVSRLAEKPVGIEYIVYIEGTDKLEELVMARHEYSVSWYNPSDGTWLDQKKKFKGDRFRSPTPDGQSDWVLYVRREGKKQNFNKSFFLESKRPRKREFQPPKELPFEIQLPEGQEIQSGRAHEFNATLRKKTIATQRMLWLWLGEVSGSGRGPRVLGTGQSGSFNVPSNLVASYPAPLSVRLMGIDGGGRLYDAFRVYNLQPPQ